jgi:hypothetical protein
METDKLRPRLILLFLRTEAYHFPDIRHQLVERPALAVASLQLGNLPDIVPIFILLDDHVKLTKLRARMPRRSRLGRKGAAGVSPLLPYLYN